MESTLASHLELNPTDIRALERLTEGPWPVGNLGQAVALSPSAASALVDRLRTRGLVERTSDPEDRRLAVVALTPEGRTAIENGLSAFSREEDALLAGFSVAALEAIRAYLAAMEGLMDRHSDRLPTGPTDSPHT